MSNANPFYRYRESISFLDSQLTFQFVNDADRWFKRVDKLTKRIDHLQPILEKWYQYMLGSFERTFQAEGRPKWARLSDYTIQDRVRRGYSSSPILDRTGEYKNVRNHMFATITNQSLAIGSRYKTKSGYNLFSLHQQGWRGGSGKQVPARPIEVQDRDKAQLTLYVRDYLIKD